MVISTATMSKNEKVISYEKKAYGYKNDLFSCQVFVDEVNSHLCSIKTCRKGEEGRKRVWMNVHLETEGLILAGSEDSRRLNNGYILFHSSTALWGWQYHKKLPHACQERKYKIANRNERAWKWFALYILFAYAEIAHCSINMQSYWMWIKATASY